MQRWLFHQIIQHFDQNRFHIVRSTCNFSEKSFQRFNKRLFRTVISCTSNGSNWSLFFLFYSRFFSFSIVFFLLQVQQSRHNKMITDVFQIKEITNKIENIKKRITTMKISRNQGENFIQQIKFQGTLIWWKYEEFFSMFQKNVSVDTNRNSIL